MVGEYELIYPLIVDLPFLNMQFIFPVRKKVTVYQRVPVIYSIKHPSTVPKAERLTVVSAFHAAPHWGLPGIDGQLKLLHDLCPVAMNLFASVTGGGPNFLGANCRLCFFDDFGTEHYWYYQKYASRINRLGDLFGDLTWF